MNAQPAPEDAIEQARTYLGSGRREDAARSVHVAIDRAESSSEHLVASLDALLHVACELGVDQQREPSLAHTIVQAQLRVATIARGARLADPGPLVTLLDSIILNLRALARLVEAVVVARAAIRICRESESLSRSRVRSILRNSVAVMIELAEFGAALPSARWVVDNPHSADSATAVVDYFQLGRCLFGVRRYDSALSAFKEALRVRDQRRPQGAVRNLDVVTNELESWVARSEAELKGKRTKKRRRPRKGR